MGLCSKSEENNDQTMCRKARDLCVADPDFKFDFKAPNTKNYIVFDIDEYLDSKETILLKDTNFRGQLPVPLHLGDYNQDGYPDVLVTTTERVLLLQSVLCTSKLCSSSAVGASRRSFSIVTVGSDALTKISNPTQATFFDIDEDVSPFKRYCNYYY
jgi:integrin alpha FG-GAP repeat containing protein 1